MLNPIPDQAPDSDYQDRNRPGKNMLRSIGVLVNDFLILCPEIWSLGWQGTPKKRPQWGAVGCILL